MTEDGGYRLYDVRPPRLADAGELGRLHVQVWREAYADSMPADYLAALDPADRTAQWSTIAAEEAEGAAAQQGRVTRLATDRESAALAGFAMVGPARDADPPVATELWGMNVLRAFHGTGAAGQLLAATLGDRPAYLWVVEDNARARAFYGKYGFVADGGRSAHEQTGTREIRMVR